MNVGSDPRDAGPSGPASSSVLVVSSRLPSEVGQGIAVRQQGTLAGLAGARAVAVAVVGRRLDGARVATGFPNVTTGLFDLRRDEGPGVRMVREVMRPLRRLGLRCEDVVMPRRIAETTAARIGDWLGEAPDVVVAVRLALAPVALALGRRWPGVRLALDLDDVESRVMARIAAVEGLRGERRSAARHGRLAARLLRAEAEFLPGFDVVAVAGGGDTADLSVRFPGVRMVVWPNRVPLVAPPPFPERSATVLFVGTLSYPPNIDAVERLARGVLPRLREVVPECRVEVVGRGLPRVVERRVAGVEGLVLRGFVEDLREPYASCGAVVAPIRSGGGTRIKILEAWAHGRPVVSSAMGIEGIEAVEGVHYLRAETDAETAEALARLLLDRALAVEMGVRGRELVEERYGLLGDEGLPGLTTDL